MDWDAQHCNSFMQHSPILRLIAGISVFQISSLQDKHREKLNMVSSHKIRTEYWGGGRGQGSGEESVR